MAATHRFASFPPNREIKFAECHKLNSVVLCPLSAQDMCIYFDAFVDFVFGHFVENNTIPSCGRGIRLYLSFFRPIFIVNSIFDDAILRPCSTAITHTHTQAQRMHLRTELLDVVLRFAQSTDPKRRCTMR